jgi:hypothetical protein
MAMSEALARGATETVKHPGEEGASLVAEFEQTLEEYKSYRKGRN